MVNWVLLISIFILNIGGSRAVQGATNLETQEYPSQKNMLNILPHPYSQVLTEIIDPTTIESITPINGGESNLFIGKLVAQGKEYCLRISQPCEESALKEQKAYLEKAAEQNISPSLYCISPKGDLTLHTFIQGAPLTLSQAQDSLLLREIVTSIKKIQSLPFNSQSVFPFSFLTTWIKNIQTLQENLPCFYRELYAKCQPKILSLITQLNKTIIYKVTHGDVDYGNILYQPCSKKVWIIDWEMARVTDSYLDLASFSVNFRLSPSIEKEMLAFYETDLSIDRLRFHQMKLAILFVHSLYFIQKAYKTLQSNTSLKWDVNLYSVLQEKRAQNDLEDYSVHYRHYTNYQISRPSSSLFLQQEAALWALLEIEKHMENF